MHYTESMDEEEAKKWVKDKHNQQFVLGKFFDTYKHTNSKIAFFMAGIPGAGKTEFAENTIRVGRSTLIPIEHDKLVEYIPTYKPENYYNFRKAGSALVTTVFDECLKYGYAFIFDGTLSHDKGVSNIRKALVAGYEVYIVYIVQDAKLAWELTLARELVTKRAISIEGFVKTCKVINIKLLEIFHKYKNFPNFNFWIIDKRGDHGMENAIAILHGPSFDKSAIIEKRLNKSYNTKTIK